MAWQILYASFFVFLGALMLHVYIYIYIDIYIDIYIYIDGWVRDMPGS
jgi:hypothetical protein